MKVGVVNVPFTFTKKDSTPNETFGTPVSYSAAKPHFPPVSITLSPNSMSFVFLIDSLSLFDILHTGLQQPNMIVSGCMFGSLVFGPHKQDFDSSAMLCVYPEVEMEKERLLTEKRQSHPRSFDARPAFSAEIDAVSLAQFYAYRESAVEKSVIEENQRSIEHQLASLGFYDTKVKHPTYAGIIAFGTNPRFYLPGSYIQYIKFPGSDMTDLPVFQKEISGDLLSVLRELDTMVSASINTTLVSITPMQEKQVSDFPIVAIRELLFNAIMHRDYESNAPIRFYWFSDRIEIQNPGGLYGAVELATLGTINDYRNPTIADVMKTLGYVNKFGYGIQRALAELKKNGNPEAEFDTPSGNKIFQVIIRKREI